MIPATLMVVSVNPATPDIEGTSSQGAETNIQTCKVKQSGKNKTTERELHDYYCPPSFLMVDLS